MAAKTGHTLTQIIAVSIKTNPAIGTRITDAFVDIFFAQRTRITRAVTIAHVIIQSIDAFPFIFTRIRTALVLVNFAEMPVETSSTGAHNFICTFWHVTCTFIQTRIILTKRMNHHFGLAMFSRKLWRAFAVIFPGRCRRAIAVIFANGRSLFARISKIDLAIFARVMRQTCARVSRFAVYTRALL